MRVSAVHTVTSLTSRVLGRPVGLLAAPAFHIGLAHRHAGAVKPQVHRRRRAGCGLDPLAFVGRDLAAQRFGGALDLFGVDRHAGQIPHPLARFGEADARRRQSHHPRRGGRQRGVLQTQGLVAGIASSAAGGAVVVGAVQDQRPQQRGEGLRAAAGVVRRLAAGARDGRIRMIGNRPRRSTPPSPERRGRGLAAEGPVRGPRSPARRTAAVR